MYLPSHFTQELNRLGTGRIPFLFIVDFEGSDPLVFPLSEVPDHIRYRVPGSVKHQNIKAYPEHFYLKKQPIPYHRYVAAFERVMFHLRQGNSYLVNLTFATPIETNLSMEEIFQMSEAPYKLLLKDRFIVFSPECFIRINDGMISSYPMKGTIDASVENAGRKVLEDPKEMAEHTTIVDLIRNDLSKVARNVEVSRSRYIDRIKTHDKEILQVSSEIRGQLPDDYHTHIGTILDALLPAGSISGAPKQRTVEIIRETEAGTRGYYTGVFGIFDGNNLDSAVMIRFIEQTPDGLQYHSGGGITHLSNPVSEYAEMADKVYLPVNRME
jgi:para-aminobenzoate synthetase component I